MSLEQLSEGDGPQPAVMRKVLLSALIFVVGFSTVFIGSGATASTFGQFIGDYLDIMAQIAGAVIIVLGLHFMGVFKIPILYREARFHAERRPPGLIGPYIIGLAFAFGWTPCVGPVLAAILMVAGSEASVSYGASLLAVYSAGLGIPFMLAAGAMKPFLNLMSRFKEHLRTVERVIGGLLVGTGILFLTGSMADIAFWILETFPSLGRIG